MSEPGKPRRPATFRLDDASVVVVDADEASRPARGIVQITPEADPAQLPVPLELPEQARRGFGWGTMFWSGVAGLVLLGTALSVAQLIENLFARSESLGILGLGFALLAALALSIVTAREIVALMRLSAIEKLHRRAVSVILSYDRDESRAIVRDLIRIANSAVSSSSSSLSRTSPSMRPVSSSIARKAISWP